jgi:formylglycine-generating enzyme required for sulfatase activity
MGSTPEEIEGQPAWSVATNELPRHPVTISYRFALAATPVTVGQYRAFITASGYAPEPGCVYFEAGKVDPRPTLSWADPGFPQGDDHPVACVSAVDADAYAAWLAAETGKPYRLPSEAEFEYAVRAGSQTVFPDGDTLAPDAGNYGAKPGERFTTPVGSYAANRFGLYDMLGNVFEWQADCYHDSYEGAPADGSAWLGDEIDCAIRILRGGAYSSAAASLRSANRDQNQGEMRMPFYGFRVALTVE